MSLGLVGDAGQFCLPDGDWFCVQCTSAAATIDEQLISEEGGDTNEAIVASAVPIVEPPYPTQDQLSSMKPSSSLDSGIGEDDTGIRTYTIQISTTFMTHNKI